jgi:putative membrane protein
LILNGLKGETMRHIIKVIKGSFVGMGSILPGISGSMIATILNIYQDLITALNKFTKHPIKAIKDVWQYIVGVIVGLGLGFIFIKLFFDAAPIPLTLLFIGFILGAIPGFKKEVYSKKYQWHHFLVVAISITLMISLLFVQERTASNGSFIAYLVVFLIGAITAISIITPGLSGATILMALGYFQVLIDLGDDVIRAFLTFNFSAIAAEIPMLLMLLLGALIGLIFMGKVMYHVLKRYRLHFYLAVLGIVIISPFNILFTLQENTDQNVFITPWYVWFIGVIMLFIGIYTTYMISKKETKTEDYHD